MSSDNGHLPASAGNRDRALGKLWGLMGSLGWFRVKARGSQVGYGHRSLLIPVLSSNKGAKLPASTHPNPSALYSCPPFPFSSRRSKPIGIQGSRPAHSLPIARQVSIHAISLKRKISPLKAQHGNTLPTISTEPLARRSLGRSRART